MLIGVLVLVMVVHLFLGQVLVVKRRHVGVLGSGFLVGLVVHLFVVNDLRQRLLVVSLLEGQLVVDVVVSLVRGNILVLLSVALLLLVLRDHVVLTLRVFVDRSAVVGRSMVWGGMVGGGMVGGGVGRGGVMISCRRVSVLLVLMVIFLGGGYFVVGACVVRHLMSSLVIWAHMVGGLVMGSRMTGRLVVGDRVVRRVVVDRRVEHWLVVRRYVVHSLVHGVLHGVLRLALVRRCACLCRGVVLIVGRVRLRLVKLLLVLGLSSLSGCLLLL